MSQLPIQIVDKDDKPISQAPMLEAQQKGLIHRIVRIMVEDGKGNILLQKRSSTMLRWPNCWDNSAAGHVDAGEDYLTAAKRELAEEIGLKNVELKEVDTYYTDSRLDELILRRFNKLYKITVNKTPNNIDPGEVAEVKWFSIKDAAKLIKDHPDLVTDGLTDVMERYY